jgi:hypothetical protein
MTTLLRNGMAISSGLLVGEIASLPRRPQ